MLPHFCDQLFFLLVIFCAVVGYVDFLIGRAGRRRIIVHLRLWRRRLARVPISQVPKAEFEFALMPMAYLVGWSGPGGDSGWRAAFAMVGAGVVRSFLFVVLATAIGLAVNEVSFAVVAPEDRLSIAIVLLSAAIGAVLMLLTSMFLNLALGIAALRRARRSRIAATILLPIASLGSLVIPAVLASAAPMMILFLLSAPFEFAHYVLGYGLGAAPSVFDLISSLEYLLRPATIVDSAWEAIRFWPRASVWTPDDAMGLIPYFAGSLALWLRALSFLIFIGAWLLLPLAKRVAFFHIRSLLELEKPALTTCAVAIAGAVKVAQEVLK